MTNKIIALKINEKYTVFPDSSAIYYKYGVYSGILNNLEYAMARRIVELENEIERLNEAMQDY